MNNLVLVLCALFVITMCVSFRQADGSSAHCLGCTNPPCCRKRTMLKKRLTNDENIQDVCAVARSMKCTNEPSKDFNSKRIRYYLGQQ